MTVAQLVAHLQRCDQNAEVRACTGFWSTTKRDCIDNLHDFEIVSVVNEGGPMIQDRHTVAIWYRDPAMGEGPFD